MATTIACMKLRPMALLGLLLLFLVGIEASGHGPMYPAACPPALAFSDTASETAKQKCYAPKVLQCSGSGSTAAYASSSSSASSSTASPSTAAPSSSSAATDSSSSSGSSQSPASDSSSASTAASTAAAASSTVATTALGQNEPCKCDLIMYLLQFKMTLTIVEQATFEQYLMVDLRVIVIDVTLTDAQKIVKCGRKMRSFCGSYPSIGNKMRVVQISDFGYAHDFAFAAAIAYEDDDSDSVDALVDNTGSTNFSLAIISGTSLDQCGVGSASNWGQFVKEHKQVHKRSIAALDKDRKRAHSHDSLKYIYFKNYPTQEACVRSIKLKAGDYDATVGDFIDFCDHHDKETQIISSLMTDDLTTGVSPFISSIDSGVQAANASGQYNAIDVQDAQTFVSNCKSQFATQKDGNSRLQLTLSLFAGKSQKCRELLKVIQISGATVSCLVADVVSIGNMCANGFACQNITLGGPGESMQETPLVDSYNVSSLVVSSQVWLDSLVFGSGYYYSYKSYHNSIVNCCYLSQYGSNVTARIECAKAKISTYSGNNVTIQANYWKTKMPTVIKQKVVSGVISADYGTLGCFCGCTSC